jgi:hypothetical protein
MTLDANGALQVGRTSGSASDGKIQVGATGTGAGAANTKLGFSLIEDDSGNGAGLWLGAMTNQNTGVIGSRTATGNIAFQTYNGGWGERARITYDGNLLVGTTGLGTIGSTSGTTMYSSGEIASAAVGDSVFSRRSTDGAVITFRRDTTSVGSINVTTTATSYVTSSDYRLKNITGPVTGAKDFIMALQPKQGTWKADGSKFVGFLAHEFQEVSPSSVVGEKDAVNADGKPIMQAMQASSPEVIANLVALAQEQQALITQLTARITALEGA